MDPIFVMFGKLVLFGGGTTAIAYGIFRWFGQKWVDQIFDKELEAFKREQNSILEEVKYEINTRFDRVTKIHEKEFEVLPLAWKKLQMAYGHMISIAAPIQEHPDLNNFSEEGLEAFLEKSELFSHQKEELKCSKNRLKYYQEKMYWIQLNTVRREFSEFRMYLRFNKIFLTKDLFMLFSEMERVMMSAEIELTVRSVDESHFEHLKRNNLTWEELRTKIQPLMEKLENEVQKRLHFK